MVDRLNQGVSIEHFRSANFEKILTRINRRAFDDKASISSFQDDEFKVFILTAAGDTHVSIFETPDLITVSSGKDDSPYTVTIDPNFELTETGRKLKDNPKFLERAISMITAQGLYPFHCQKELRTNMMTSLLNPRKSTRFNFFGQETPPFSTDVEPLIKRCKRS